MITESTAIVACSGATSATTSSRDGGERQLTKTLRQEFGRRCCVKPAVTNTGTTHTQAATSMRTILDPTVSKLNPATPSQQGGVRHHNKCTDALRVTVEGIPSGAARICQALYE